MSTVPDPTSVHWPEMIDNQGKTTVFLKPLVTSPRRIRRGRCHACKRVSGGLESSHPASRRWSGWWESRRRR